ncbi:hypothetical protein SESBI_49267, partial [Sesbania bispinosa]
MQLAVAGACDHKRQDISQRGGGKRRQWMLIKDDNEGRRALWLRFGNNDAITHD